MRIEPIAASIGFLFSPPSVGGFELELIQSHMAQKPVLRGTEASAAG